MGCVSSVSNQVKRSSVSDQVNQVRSNDFHANFVLGVKLGQGAFGQVHAVTQVSAMPQESNDESQHGKAVKILCLKKKGDPVASAKLQENALREIKIWKIIGVHPNCVCLHDRFFDNHFCFIVMEKLDYGLFQALDTMEEINERNLGNIFAQMLLGIAHCHSVNVVHRDIKCDNYLMDGQTVKLADFGLSAVLPNSGELSGIRGTAPFMCPEMLSSERCNEKADVWSFAVVVYVLMFGQFPYVPLQRSAKTMKQAIVRGTPSPSFDVVLPAVASKENAGNITFRSDIAVSFVKAVLMREPLERPSADEALDMPWMLAARQGNHLPEKDLPSLRPMLLSARTAGAFEVRDLHSATQVDFAFSALQMKRRSVPLPATLSANIVKPRTVPHFNPTGNCCRKSEWGLSNHSTNSGSSNLMQGSSSDRSFQNEWSKASVVKSF